MARIFICQRPRYSSFVLSEIHHKLELKYGSEAILSSIEDTPLGLDIRIHVGHHIMPSDVILLIIDGDWTKEPLFEHKNIIRLVIEVAIKMNIPIIPVYLNEAKLPQDIELPSSISSIQYIQSHRIKEGNGLKRDINRLIEGISHLKSLGYQLFHLKPNKDLQSQLARKNKTNIWNWLKTPIYALVALVGCSGIGIIAIVLATIFSSGSIVLQLSYLLVFPFSVASGIILAMYILKKG